MGGTFINGSFCQCVLRSRMVANILDVDKRVRVMKEHTGLETCKFCGQAHYG